MEARQSHPLGVFDSGIGGLTIYKALREAQPAQSFIYLGDHQNAPYGSRLKEDLYHLTTRNIDWLFDQGCTLVILACNTASSVLRRIQHEWLPRHHPENRVLGVIVPTIEMVSGVAWNSTPARSGTPSTVGVFATEATVRSEAYPLEIHKRAPHMRVIQQACHLLTSLIEASAPREKITEEVRGYVRELRTQLDGKWPDYVLLGCTHYAFIDDLFRAAFPPITRLISQPDCIAASLEDYLKRHPHHRSNAANPAPLLFTTGKESEVNKNARCFLPGDVKFTSVKI